MEQQNSQSVSLSKTNEQLQKLEKRKGYLQLVSSYNLPKEELITATAILNGVRIADESTNNLKGAIINLVIIAHTNCGQVMDKEALGLTIESLTNTIQVKFCHLTIAEMSLAFDRGWQGEYGKYFGLNNKTYLDWLQEYVFSEKKIAAAKAIAKAREETDLPKKPEPTAEEKLKSSINFAVRQYQEFCSGQEIFDFGNVSYRFLERIGLINFPAEKKKEIYNEVLEFRKVKAMQAKRNGILKRTMEAILADATSETAVQSDAKRRSLVIYFQNCKEMQIDLLEEITEALKEK